MDTENPVDVSTRLSPPPLPAALIPYATPAGFAPMGAASMWREGATLVALKNAPFPDRCVKCNAPLTVGGRWKKKLYWHPPALYILIAFPGLLIYAVVALIVRKQTAVEVGLCEVHRGERKKKILIGWAIFVAGLLILILGIYAANTPNWRDSPAGPIGICVGVLTIIGSLIWAVIATRVLSPKKIDDKIARFNGAGREFLDSLPGNAG